MSVAHIERLYSVAEYLDFERTSQERHEYLDGQVYAMAGESLQHAAICTNLSGVLRSQLLGGPCQVFSKDVKVRSGPLPVITSSKKGLFSYPDILVVCGEPDVLDRHDDVVMNPRVIIEVLSPSTERFDRTQKFMRYRQWLPSLTDYVLVAQNQPFIEQFSRGENGVWTIGPVTSDLADSIRIGSIDCSLPLAEIYDRVTFPAPKATEGDREG
ncbi:MAG TPA: Uma2 family endonuclease [Blastocatellia bacterium]